MKNTSQVTENLSVLLASTYTLYLKVQNYHWNVEGKEFFAVHEFTEALYMELALQNDAIAERIRMLGEKAPGTFREFLKISLVKEAEGENSTAEIIQNLASDYTALITKIKEIIVLSNTEGDDGTADLLTPYVSSYEKTLWMLKSVSR